MKHKKLTDYLICDKTGIKDITTTDGILTKLQNYLFSRFYLEHKALICLYFFSLKESKNKMTLQARYVHILET
ncbi:hypothetical protein BpHYR1_050365 [Brachionus plicatilis]|uniref:Uncharacterized protein n=1 Tax=Brachionus plicatilis TaxID=10195 RepID=A0A3M7SUZ2_BRAPC|nr:hypothetical protein BpHYR1_050365 [Brachionus plicatilis]